MLASKNNSVWESIVYEQQTVDNDWIEFQGEVTVDPSSIEVLNYDSANSTTSELRFIGFENYESQILLTDVYESFVVGSIVNDSRGISSASYDNVSFDVGSEEYSPDAITLSPDGTKMFVAGTGYDSVHSYTLSTSFDLSSASYDSVSFDVSSEESNPYGIAFNTDGTKMFVVGSSSDSVHSYTLSTSFDLSSASYDNVPFDVGSEVSSPSDIAFSPDGTKMFVVGRLDSDTIYSYTLSTPFDLSTASYDGVSFDVSSEDSDPRDVAFSPDGTKMFVVGADFDSVYSYTLSTPFDLSTASYDGVSFDVSSEDSSPEGIAFNSDGTKMFVIGSSSDNVHSYTTNFFATYVNPLSSVPANVYDDPNNQINQNIVLSNSPETAFVSDKAFDVLSYSTDTNTVDVTLGYDNDSDAIVEINDSVLLQKGFDLSTASYDNVFFDVSSEDTSPQGITFNTNGTKMFVIGDNSDSVYSYTLSTPFDLSTASHDVSFNISSEESLPTGIVFNTDGTKMFVVGFASNFVHSYTLSTGFDLSTASYDSVSLDVSSEDTIPEGIAFNTDGTKMFVIGRGSDFVHSYTLSTGFDLSTASYDSVSFDVSSKDSSPQGITFNTNGTKMFVIGSNSDSVYSYTLSTPFDLLSASYDNVSFSVSSEDSSLQGIAFSTDGTKMFVVGGSSFSVYSYTLELISGGSFTVNDIVVSNSETTLTLLGTPSIAPSICSLPDWSTQVEFTSFNESNNNLVMTSDRYLTDNGKRFVKYKLTGDTGVIVSNAKVNLWKKQ